MSNPFNVTRGVHQGDLLSCLLFDIAIEPLSIMLRTTGKLRGLRIPGQRDNLIVTLFADNTTVYLSEFNELEDLQEIMKI